MKRPWGRFLCALWCAATCISAASADLPADPRLDQKITLREAGTTLKQLFQRLETQAGVALRVWGIPTEQRVILYAVDRPLREVLNALATACGAEWHPDAKGANRYVLHAKPQTGEPFRRRIAHEHARRLPQLLRSLYDPEWLQNIELPEELQDTGAKIDIADTYRQVYRQINQPLEFLKHLTPKETKALRRGNTLEFSSRTDPRFAPEWLKRWKSVLRDELFSLAEAYGSPKGDEAQAEYYSSVLSKNLEQGDEVRLRLRFDALEGKLECAVGLFARGELLYGKTYAGIDYSEPHLVAYEDEEGRPRIPPQHPWAHVVFPDDLTMVDNEGNVARRALRPDEILVQPLPPPALDDDWFSEDARSIFRIAEAVGKPFAAEFYWSPKMYDRSVFTEEYVWRTEGDWVLVSHRDRAFARAQDIPPSKLRTWFFKPGRRGVLTLQDLAEMGDYAQAATGKEWFEYLAAYGAAHHLVIHGELPNPYVLQCELLGLPSVHHGLLYALESLEPCFDRPQVFSVLGALTASQRRALVNGQPLPLAALSPKAREAVYTLWGVDDAARTPAFWSRITPRGSVSIRKREVPISLFMWTPEQNRTIKGVETALEVVSKIREEVGWEYEKLRAQGLYCEVCCVRQWYLCLAMGAERKEYLLFRDLNPLLQRGILPRTR